jgi:hypothetical protein
VPGIELGDQTVFHNRPSAVLVSEVLVAGKDRRPGISSPVPLHIRLLVASVKRYDEEMEPVKRPWLWTWLSILVMVLNGLMWCFIIVAGGAGGSFSYSEAAAMLLAVNGPGLALSLAALRSNRKHREEKRTFLVVLNVLFAVVYLSPLVILTK